MLQYHRLPARANRSHGLEARDAKLMNLFQLVLKQMRQRSLSTWLTLLSVLLGVSLAVAIMIIRREGRSVFGQSEFGYEAIVGTKGSPLQLVLNTVYQLDKSPGNIKYSFYE